MKKIVLIALLALTIFSCKKEKAGTTQSSSNLIGKWNLLVYSGSIAGGTYHPTSPTAIEFTADSAYKRYTNNLVIAQGSFHIRAMANPAYSPTSKDSIIYYLNQIITQSFVIKAKDTLYLNDYNISDGYSYKYVRDK